MSDAPEVCAVILWARDVPQAERLESLRRARDWASASWVQDPSWRTLLLHLEGVVLGYLERDYEARRVGAACPYCGAPTTFSSDSAHIYAGRDYGPVWECRPCGAYVGCHRPGVGKGDGSTPLGTVADAATRALRKRAHAVFDPRWRGGQPRGRSRRRAYTWLAEQLGMTRGECHIGMMQADDLRRVIALCEDE